MIYFILSSIMLTSVLVGYKISKKYNNRYVFYNNLVKFADILNLNIYHLNENIDEIFNKFIEELDNISKIDFNKIRNMILKNVVTIDNLKSLNMTTNLSNNEIKEFYEFIKKLGNCNTESQIHIIDGYKKVFEERKNLAVIDKKQKGNIALRLSVSIGVVLCIIIL